MTRVVLLSVLLLSAASLALDGARYLIITTDALYPSILPLAEWRQVTGLQTKVVKLSEIGSDTTSIKNYVRNAYSTWPIRPEYVLLVGSPANLLSRYYYVQHGWSYYSDNIYGDMTGDLEAELPVGRLPARSAAQLEVMLAKTKVYERNPDLTDSLWMRRLTTIVREGNDPDDTIYWNNVRRAATQAGAAGFVRCDSFSYSRGHSSANVISSVNSGTGFVLYRGTAGGNWYQPFDVNPALCANGSRLPIILSITCETMTLTPNESMVGDAWMKTGSVATPRGAVAFFGNTHSASNVARVRGAVCRGFFDGLFPEHGDRLGMVAMRAKRQLRAEFPTYTSDYRGFNLLGDPALPVWTATPRILEVVHPASIEPRPQTLNLAVRHNTVPVANAMVCASMDTTVYATGVTNAAGEVTLDVNPTHTGHLRLVVTGRNLYPYDALIPVTYTAVVEPVAPRPAGEVRLRASPSHSRGTTTLHLSGALPARASLIVRDAAGRVLQSSACARPSETVLALKGRAPGVYFCSLEDAAGSTLATARFTKLD